MSKPGKQVLWIRLSSIKKLFIGICLAIVFVTVATLNIPAVKTTGQWGLPLSGKVIVLDAGHGGPDGGAVSKQGLIEKDVNLAIALYLRDYLQQAGAVVYMTREGDYDLAGKDTKGYSKRKMEDLKQRAKMIENSNADLFLSIHLNSFPGRWSGAQTFYYPNHPDNKTLAVFIQEEIKRNLENTDRVAKTVNHVYLLKAVKMPAALVEVGFLSHPEESQLLRDEGYQRKVAAAVYKGMLRYLSGEKANLSPEM